ncbi:MAG: zinc finger protein [Verrucomicrobiota bacterium]
MRLDQRRSAEALRQSCPLPDLMHRLGLGNLDKPQSFCPFHENRLTGAFSVYRKEGRWRWNCFAGCGGGDEVDFLVKLRGVDLGEAFRLWEELAGAAPLSMAYVAPVSASKTKPRQEPVLPADFHPGSREELETVATLRQVNFWAVASMQQNGVLGFGTVCGVPSWLVKDGSGKCVEARRMNGLPFPAVEGLGERKAHTLRGSLKSWPVGLVAGPGRLRKVLLLEGSGDLVAGYHYVEPVSDWLPVAFLGAGIQNLHPEALGLLAGKQVRIVSHVDAVGADARERFGRQLQQQAGCSVDWFDLEGLRKADGSPIKDLNDCTAIHPEDAGELGGLLK